MTCLIAGYSLIALFLVVALVVVVRRRNDAA